jgi:hypothetical protein
MEETVKSHISAASFQNHSSNRHGNLIWNNRYVSEPSRGLTRIIITVVIIVVFIPSDIWQDPLEGDQPMARHLAAQNKATQKYAYINVPKRDSNP